MKRVLAVSDISCVGKCSLTVALPIVSAFGIECSVLPTAILSTHTAFSNYTFLSLSDELDKIEEVFGKENISFSAIFAGYLGRESDIDFIKNYVSKTKTPLYLDPAMGDNGSLYKGFSKSYSDKMKELIKISDIVVPNLTEACLLTDTDIHSVKTEEDVKALLDKLVDMGAKCAVITSVSVDDETLSVMAKMGDKYYLYGKDKRGKMFHGTGDVFASALFSSYLKTGDIEKSIHIATDFVYDSILKTENDERSWYGVNFEKAIPDLVKKIYG